MASPSPKPHAHHLKSEEGAFTRERLRATHLITVCGSTAGSTDKLDAPAGGKKHAQACCVERHKKIVWVCDATRKHAIACPVMRYYEVVNHLEKTNSAQKKTISARYWPLWRQSVNDTRQSLHVMGCYRDNLWTGKDNLQTWNTSHKTISVQVKTISALY